MRILVLSQLQGSPGTAAFLEVARAAGHEATLENPLHARVVVGDGPPRVAGSSAADHDVVFTRMGSATPERGFDVLRWLELAGAPCANRSGPLRVARDKLRTYLELAPAGVPLPRTVVADGGHATAALVEELGEPPWVLKDPVGTKGAAVRRVESVAELDALRATHERFLLQRFVAESAGTDVRVLVVGGRAVAAIRRRARPGEWRSNLHLGGAGSPHHPTDAEVDAAERAAAALDLDVAGVDLLPSDRGPLVAEVNGSPGFAGLRAVHGDAPVERVLEHLAELVRARA